MSRRSRQLLVSATAAVLLVPAAASAAEPVGDEELLEFLGSVDEVEDEDFQEYLADVDVQKVATKPKPKAKAVANPVKSEQPKSEEP
jgi:hypothetical protein